MDKLNIGNVCISSIYSRETGFIDYRYVACKAAEDLGYYVYRNPETPGSTQSEFEKFLENKRPIIILLVGQVKSAMVYTECKHALSLGLPIITMLWTENKKIKQSTKNLMKSISKATFEKECSCFCNCEELYESLQKRLAAYEAERMTTTAQFIPQHAQIYTTSQRIISNAKKRIIVCQRTSSILLGPRKGIKHEQEFYEEIIKWIDHASSDMEFLHIFAFNETRSELKKDDYDLNNAKKQLMRICSEKRLSLVIRSSYENIMPFVICDNNLIVPLKVGIQEYNIFLPNYITDGASISKIVADFQRIKGELLFFSESASLNTIDSFYFSTGSI